MSGAPVNSAAWLGISRLLGKRVLSALLTLLLVSMVVFAAASLLPGDAAQEVLGQSATAEQVTALRHEMGLDQPAVTRYAHWLTSMLRGDPGWSYIAGMSVSELIGNRLVNTLSLAGATALVSVAMALTTGIVSAIHRGGRLDRALNLITLSLVAMPEFLIATVFVLIFSVKLTLLPPIAMISQEATWGELLRSCALPVACLAFVVTAQMARLTRAAVADELDRPYVEMARLKGVPLRRIVLFHIMPNAAGPVLNAMALSLSYLMGGALIIETIFSFPGLASLMVNAVTSRDMPLLQACAMVFCTAYLAMILIADVVAILANPRLRA
jgi:peptide/nickel transport system permease protein